MSAPAALPVAVGLGISKLSKGLAAVLAIGFVISEAFPFTVDYLALVPGKSIPFAWNLLTAGYFEHTLVGLTGSIAGLLFFGKLLEPVWGSKEFLKFIAVVSFFTSICTFVISIFLYYVTGNEDLLYTPISGFHGVLAGFVVAVKQIFPDYEISTLHFLKLRAKWLPGIMVLMVLLVGIFLDDPIVFVPFVLFGVYGSWIYLRYFQRRSEANTNGDASGEFAFATFFPEFAWPFINPMASVFEKLCCGRRAQSLDDQDPSFVLGGKPLPGSDPAEATRRRERGARALEERLSAASKASDADGQGGKSTTGSNLPVLEPLVPEDIV